MQSPMVPPNAAEEIVRIIFGRKKYLVVYKNNMASLSVNKLFSL